MSGYGAFGKYRERIGKVEKARCWGWGYEQDTAEHAIFFCEKNEGKRRDVEEELGEAMTPDTIIKKMMETTENWKK